MKDDITFLLRRAMNDDGPEGEVAWNMFVQRAKAKSGKIMFVFEARDYANPLSLVVEDQDREIAALEEELFDLKQLIGRTMKSFQKVL